MAKDSGILSLNTMTLFLSELFGTAVLVFFGCASCLNWNNDNSHLQIVLSFGFAVLISVQIFGCVSGAHINPSVTLAAVVYKLISVKIGCVYVVAQLLGAFMGYGLLKVLTPSSPQGKLSFCATKPHDDVNDYQAFGIEFIATATLIWFCCAVWDPRNSKTQDSIPIRFGLAVAGLASATGHYTGGSFNPARSLAPALWNNDFDSHWVYWAGPLTGSLCACVIYKYIFHREVIETENYEYHLQNLSDTMNKA